MSFPQHLVNYIVPLAMFGVVAALAWWGLNVLAAGKPRTLERLEELKDPRKRRKVASESALKKSSAFTSVLERASPSLAKPLQPKNEAEISKLKTKLAVAGFRGEAAGSVYLGLRFSLLVAGFFIGGGTTALLARHQPAHPGDDVRLSGHSVLSAGLRG